MSDFGKRMAASIRDTEGQHEEVGKRPNTENAAFVVERDAAFVERERLKEKLAPGLWHKFKETIVSKCKEVNDQMGREYYRVHDTIPTQLHIAKSNPTAILRLAFDEDAHRIHYEVGKNFGDYLIGIDETTGQAILTDGHKHEFILDPTAELLLEDWLAKAAF